MELPLEAIERSFNNQFSNWAHEALDELADNFTITDPCISGHPIVFASQGFLKMCGYSRDEVIGRNGRMFQGPGTNRRAVMEIREAIREERATETSILNYHKNGAPFWILFHMSPVFSNLDGRITHFVGVQVPISRKSVGLRGRIGKDGVELCRQGYRSCEFLLGSCRRAVCCTKSTLESSSKLDYDSVLDSTEDIEYEDSCGASESEKQKASNAASNIISVLSRYSELGGNPVSGRRCNMHGYARHEVLGRSRNLFCGLETNPSTLELIEGSIKVGQPCKAQILYYRKDQSSFRSHLSISPVRNASGKIAYFVEVQIDEDDEGECKNRHRLSPEQRQLSAIGAVKVAVRTQSIGPSSHSKIQEL